MLLKDDEHTQREAQRRDSHLTPSHSEMGVIALFPSVSPSVIRGL